MSQSRGKVPCKLAKFSSFDPSIPPSSASSHLEHWSSIQADILMAAADEQKYTEQPSIFGRWNVVRRYDICDGMLFVAMIYVMDASGKVVRQQGTRRKSSGGVGPRFPMILVECIYLTSNHPLLTIHQHSHLPPLSVTQQQSMLLSQELKIQASSSQYPHDEHCR